MVWHGQGDGLRLCAYMPHEQLLKLWFWSPQKSKLKRKMSSFSKFLAILFHCQLPRSKPCNNNCYRCRIKLKRYFPLVQFRNASAWSVLAALNLSGKGTACENLKRDKICPSFIEAKKWQLLWSFSNLVSWICWHRTEEDVASAPISNRQVVGKQQEDGIPRKGLSLKSLPELDNRHKHRGCITTYLYFERDRSRGEDENESGWNYTRAKNRI